MKKLITTSFAIFALVLYVAANALAPAATKNMTNAEVRKIDKEAGKITLKHEDIKNLDMPGMTMVFHVTDKALLDKLQVGDKVKFIADKQQGKFVVTDIQTTSGVK
jgi:Cu/Ag efflux protein CusF